MKNLDLNKIWELVLGETELELMVVGFLFAIFGAAVNLVLEVSTRKTDNEKNPKEYCNKFLIKDNYKRVILSIMLILVYIRFCEQLIGVDLNVYWSFFIGFCSDRLGEYLKTIKRKFFSNNKSYNEVPQETGNNTNEHNQLL